MSFRVFGKGAQSNPNILMKLFSSTAFKGIVHRDLTVVKTRLKQSV
jgi:hypothetical protein